MSRSILPAVLLSAALAVPASAAVFDNVQGVVIEGGVKPADDAPKEGLIIGDFNTKPGDPLLNIIGDTQIYGGVAHRFPGEYKDSWSMDFGNDFYDIAFNWANRTLNFDGQIVINGVGTDLGKNGSLSLGIYTGLVTFVVDPIFGLFSPVRSDSRTHEVATWDLQAQKVETQVGVVPLPASAAFLLSGLIGFGVLRRRKAA